MLLSADRENNADEFWLYVNAYDVIHSAPISAEARAAVAPLLTDSTVESVEMDEALAAEALAWLATLPGWNDGPEYAPHPIVVH